MEEDLFPDILRRGVALTYKEESDKPDTKLSDFFEKEKG